MNTPKNTSKAEQGRQAESRAIVMLARFGALNRYQIGRLCYRSAASKDSLGHKLAQRMLAKKLVLQRKQKGAPTLYALSAKGAARHLQEQGEGACFGSYLLRFDSRHRRAANDTTIELMEAYGEDFAFTEREILTGRAPLKTLDGKMPDALAVLDDGGVIWVEIEACRRGGRDLNALADWVAYKAFGAAAEVELPANCYMLRVLIRVADPVAATIGGRLERALTRRRGAGWTDNRVDYE